MIKKRVNIIINLSVDNKNDFFTNEKSTMLGFNILFIYFTKNSFLPLIAIY